MNRKERRASSKAGVDPVVAAHEAGHAVARYLTAEMMGLKHDKAIDSIVVQANLVDPSPKTSFDGKAKLHIQATTYGPMFSAEIETVRKTFCERQGKDFIKLTPGTEVYDFYLAGIAEARTSGCDIEGGFAPNLL